MGMKYSLCHTAQMPTHCVVKSLAAFHKNVGYCMILSAQKTTTSPSRLNILYLNKMWTKIYHTKRMNEVMHRLNNDTKSIQILKRLYLHCVLTKRNTQENVSFPQ